MKKLILIVALAVCLVAGCSQGQKPTLTLWGTYEVDTVGARVGIKPDVNSPLEAGIYGAWRPSSEDPPNIFGVYTLYTFAEIDVNNPFPGDLLPDKIKAAGYVGGDITVDFADEGRKARGGPLVGIKWLDAIATEVRYQFVNGPLEANYDDAEAVFALCVPIKF